MPKSSRRIDGDNYEVFLGEAFPKRSGVYNVSVTTWGFNGSPVGGFTVRKDEANKGWLATFPWGASILRNARHLAVTDGVNAVVQRAKAEAREIAENPGDNVLVAFRNVPGYHVNRTGRSDSAFTQIAYDGHRSRSLYVLKGHNPDSAHRAATDLLAQPIADGANYQDGESTDGTKPEFALFTNIHDALRYLNEGIDNDLELFERYEVSHTVLGAVLFDVHPDQRALADEAVRRADEITTKAAELLALLESNVPSSTAHFAVEDAKKALRHLSGERYRLTASQVIAGVK